MVNVTFHHVLIEDLSTYLSLLRYCSTLISWSTFYFHKQLILVTYVNSWPTVPLAYLQIIQISLLSDCLEVEVVLCSTLALDLLARLWFPYRFGWFILVQFNRNALKIILAIKSYRQISTFNGQTLNNWHNIRGIV